MVWVEETQTAGWVEGQQDWKETDGEQTEENFIYIHKKQNRKTKEETKASP